MAYRQPKVLGMDTVIALLASPSPANRPGSPVPATTSPAGQGQSDCKHHHVFESPKPGCELVHGVCKFCGDEEDRPARSSFDYGRGPLTRQEWRELEARRG